MRYRRPSVLSILAAALLGSPAAPLPTTPWGEMLVKHTWTHIPDNWITLGHPPDAATIDLHVALKADRESALVDALQEVSQPRHPKYGAYLTKAQVAQLVAPHPDTLELVISWLGHNGVAPSSISLTHGGGWLTVVGVPVSRANKLLRASYQLYYHPGTNETILRTVGYALPAALHTHVRTVVPTTAFTSTRLLQPEEMPSSRSSGAAEQAENATSGEPVNMLSHRQAYEPDIHPSFLRWAYRMDAYVPAAADRNKLGIVGYSSESPSQPDIIEFMLDYSPDAVAAIPHVESIVDGYQHLRGVQANLETQYALALTFPTPVFYYRGTGYGVQLELDPYGLGTLVPSPNDQYLQWLNYMTKQADSEIPRTISLGYGTSEPSISLEYAVALCEMFAQLGARGVSILAASGDAGVGQGKGCQTKSGDPQFYTIFPASCPWVTSVGGTKLNTPYSVMEVASGFSGGGFSAFFTAEKYQWPDLGTFLWKLGSKHEGLYNPDGRGVPDIASLSSNYQMVFVNQGQSFGKSRKTLSISSTACSTITAAALFSLLNDYRLAKGKPPLGFLNPWLYYTGWLGFDDIISGTNPGCNSVGFSAGIGWDPVTGLGTPDFIKLQSILNLDDFAPLPEEPPKEPPEEPPEEGQAPPTPSQP